MLGSTPTTSPACRWAGPVTTVPWYPPASLPLHRTGSGRSA